MNKKIISLFCLILVLSMVFIACEKQPEHVYVETEAPNADNSGEVEEDTIEEVPDPDLPAVDFGLREIRIVQRGDRWREDWNADKDNGGMEDFAVLQQALFNRNAYLEEKYNIVFEHLNYSRSDVGTNIKNQILSNSHTFDIIDMGPMDLALNAGSGMLAPMQQLSYLNLDAVYWYPELNESYSYRDTNFFLVGASNMFTLWSASCVWYNMDLAEDVGIAANIFEEVENKNWTVEKMLEMAAMSHYLDNDGVTGPSAGDRFGIGQTNGGWYTIFYGSDLSVGAKDENGRFKVDVSDERIFDLVETIVEYQNNANIAINVNAGIDQWNAFRDGNVLFLVETIAAYNTIRHGDLEYGILPNPMLVAGQDRYYTTFHKGHSSALALPADVPTTDYDMLGMILEDANYMSRVEQWPAYYEVLLQGRAAQNPESAEMLELVFVSLSQDPCNLYSDFIDSAIRTLVAQNGISMIQSTLNSAAGQAQAYIDNIMNGMDDIIDKYS